ncbi:MAG: hypothetical protein ACFCD0_04720 [Gemmataceae bacterium]
MRTVQPILFLILVVVVGLSSITLAFADSPLELPVLVDEDFSKGAKRWEPLEKDGWKIVKLEKGKGYSQWKKKSTYRPPYRSPLHIALLRKINVGSFVLDAKVKSTIKDYNHRDVCLFFGFQDRAHFYYVHFGKRADPRANQIFIVNKAPRIKISTKTTEGTPWDDEWHHLRVIRDVSTGKIEVFYDDMKTPIMIATDKTFTHGRIGIGSFDDTAVWASVKLRGELVKK